MRFLSQIQLGATLPEFPEETVKNEPMLFNCDLETAWTKGGPITRTWIDALRPEFRRGIFDTRVHMLMPGWYPCIPGWHHDDVPRSTPTGQPNYASPEYFSRHCMALVNGRVAPTEFLIGAIEVPTPEPGRVVYEQWDAYLEASAAPVRPGWVQIPDDNGARQGRREPAPNRTLIYFDADTFHRGVPAVANGWRWFGRVSIDTHRKPTNEIRRQVQVYMSAVNAGW